MPQSTSPSLTVGTHRQKTKGSTFRISTLPGAKPPPPGELLRELDGRLNPGDEWSMEVEDEKGEQIYLLEFKTKASDPCTASPHSSVFRNFHVFSEFYGITDSKEFAIRKSSTKAMQTFGMMKSLSPDELEEAREVLLDFLSKRPGTDEHTAAVEKLDVSQKSQNVPHADARALKLAEGMKGQLKRGPPTDEILLLLWLIAVDRGFVCGHLLNQARDPVQGLLVGDVDSNALVVRNLAIDLVAFDAHGLTAWSRAGARRTLSHRWSAEAAATGRFLKSNVRFPT